MRQSLFLIVLLFIVLSCSLTSTKSKNEISIMTYNLENLFDDQHDEGKSDWSWMSLASKSKNPQALKYCHSLKNNYYKKTCLELDWSDEVIRAKIKNLSQVIKLYNNGAGADIVVFQEIENLAILKRLVDQGLGDMNYDYLSLVEGPDNRGIDLAIISKYPISETKYHQLDIKKFSKRPTRGILEATIKAHGKNISVLANHWPSQGNPDGARLMASKVLKDIAKNLNTDIIIATGDFNTLSDDSPHGINQNVLPYFEDVETKARKTKQIAASGTHWYRGHWTSLDKIFIANKSLKNLKVDYSSFEILNHKFMLEDLNWQDYKTGKKYFDKDVPRRFDVKKKSGYSDHLPVAITLKI